ncbi:MAG: hypothetical protein RQ966_12070 [Acetobacteraceae bacterium]|nr:hypothetical protein [Acetobacteraceae bacterium]
MAKQPGTPKAKTAAPAQFDMNRSERKGGRGGPGGPGRRGRDEKRPPSRIESLPPVLVDRGQGWVIWKVGKVDQATHAPVRAEYHLVFEGHDPLVFDFLGAARDRSKEPPPEKPEPVAAVETPEEATAEQEPPAEQENVAESAEPEATPATPSA